MMNDTINDTITISFNNCEELQIVIPPGNKMIHSNMGTSNLSHIGFPFLSIAFTRIKNKNEIINTS